MIALQKVSFSYGDQPVLSAFDLEVKDGECVCLFGPSGCGKTTVLRLILGLETPLDGTVCRPPRIAALFQEDRLLPWMSVRRNVCLPLAREEQDKAEQLLRAVGLQEAAGKRISALSGGMRRRVSLVRAIAYGGDALLLDEPFNGLDAENKKILAEIIHREYIAKNKSVLLITHVPEDAALLGAKVVYMK